MNSVLFILILRYQLDILVEVYKRKLAKCVSSSGEFRERERERFGENELLIIESIRENEISLCEGRTGWC